MSNLDQAHSDSVIDQARSGDMLLLGEMGYRHLFDSIRREGGVFHNLSKDGQAVFHQESCEVSLKPLTQKQFVELLQREE